MKPTSSCTEHETAGRLLNVLFSLLSKGKTLNRLNALLLKCSWCFSSQAKDVTYTDTLIIFLG